MSNSLQPHGLHQARPSCPSPLPKFISITSMMPSSHLILWHPLLLPSIFPSIGNFYNELSVHIRWPGTSASASVLPVNIRGWSPLRLTGLVSLLSKGLSGVFSSTTFQRHQLSGALPSYSSALTTICDHWEDHSLDYIDLCWESNVSAFQHTV